MRHVDEVLDSDSVRNSLFSWAQQNDNGMALESDLYGAAMLLLMAWTEDIALSDLLAWIDQCTTPLCGFDLEELMETTTGESRLDIMERARHIGEKLYHSNYLAKRVNLDKSEG
jgi:hypothetical protein